MRRFVYYTGFAVMVPLLIAASIIAAASTFDETQE